MSSVTMFKHINFYNKGLVIVYESCFTRLILPTCKAGCFMCKILKESLPCTVSTHTYNSSAKGEAKVHILNIKLYLI